MALHIMMAAFCLLLPDDGDKPIAADQLERILKAQHAEITDITFAFEGEMRFVGSTQLLSKDSKGKTGSTAFSGQYSLRNDGAIRLETIYRDIESNSFNRIELLCLLRTVQESLVRAPGQKTGFPSIARATPSSYQTTCSPQRIYYRYLLQELTNYEDYGYEYLGKELVNGHECVVAQFYTVPIKFKSPDMPLGKLPRMKFWIDLRRGGHPLRSEFYQAGNLAFRNHNIELEQVAVTKTQNVWLPQSGETETFLKGPNQYGSSPVFIEKYVVIKGSEQINKTLNDQYFRAKYTAPSQVADAFSLMKTQFDNIPVPRTDSSGVKKQLDDLLVAADKESSQLVASPRAFGHDVEGYLPLILGTLAGILLISACVIYIRAKRSRGRSA